MFLATTALEEFWDKTQEILFLGEWCKLYSRRKEYEKLRYKTFPFVWKDRTHYEQAYYYCNTVFEDVLEALTNQLNKIHNITKSKQYYRIILGNWLIHYIYQLYDKYVTIKNVFSEHKDLQTFLLSSESYYIPLDYNEFISKITEDDLYNLQMYSNVISNLGFSFPIKSSGVAPDRIKYTFSADWKNRVMGYLFRIASFISNLFYDELDRVTITQPYFLYNGLSKRLNILVRSKLKCVFDDMRYDVRGEIVINRALRDTKRLFESDIDEFKSLINRVIFEDLPLLFLEGWRDFREKVLSLPINRSKIFYTANATYGNNVFKFLIAEYHDRSILIESQHGGVNGTHLMALEEIDQKVCDYFFTFGWRETEKQIPMYHFNVYTNKKRSNSKLVLYVKTGQPRYIYRFHSSYSGSEFLLYINNGINFLKNIHKRIEILIRLYPKNYGWDEKMRIIDAGLNVKFDNHNKSFLSRLRNSYIMVSDHIGSTYLESMAMNVPTIVFCDPEITKFRLSAKKIYEKLEECKIIHSSPLSAANHLNNVYENVDSWWRQSSVQEVRREFVNRYARYTNQYAKKFLSELRKIKEKV